MLSDEKVSKIRYTDLNGVSEEKWVGEYAIFAEIKRLEQKGYTVSIVG